MAIITTTNFTVEYDSNIMFAYSPNFITITRRAGSLVNFTLAVNNLATAESVTLNYSMSYIGNVLQIDLSRLLRLFDGDISIDIIDGKYRATITPYVIKGAKGKLEDFGGTYHIRHWFDYVNLASYELYMNFLIASNATVYLRDFATTDVAFGNLIVNTRPGIELVRYKPMFGAGTIPERPYTIFAEGEVFTEGMWETANWFYRVTPTCTPKRPIYLRWVAKNGLTFYWLFSIYETTIETEDKETYARLPLNEGEVVNEWSSRRALEVRKTAKIYTTEVTNEEYKVVKTLASAPIVEAFDEGSSAWYRVRVATGSHADVKGNLKEVEFEIEFAPEHTAFG